MIRRVRNEIPRLLVLAGPIIVSQLLQMSMGTVDTLMVGRLGASSLAAVALGNAIYHPFFLICAGVLTAVSPLVSRSHGAGEVEPIGRTVAQALLLGTLLAVPAMVIIWNVEGTLVRFGIEPDVATGTQSYLRAVSFAFAPGLWYIALRHFVEALGKPRPVMLITLAGAALNVGANYILMYGHWGFPVLGVTGTGYATSVVTFALVIVLALYVHGRHSLRDYRVFSQLGRPDRLYLRRLFRLGWPIGIMFGVETGLFATAAFMMGAIGTNELAAHQIAIQTAALTFMVPLGIAFATTVRVGHELGAGNEQGARVAGLTGIGVAATVMCFSAVTFLLFPREILSLFIDLSEADNSDVISIGVILLGLAAIFQVFDGVQVAAAGALRGLADTTVPMYIAFATYWGIGLTSAYGLAFVLRMGPRGVWWGLVLGLASASILLTWRFALLVNRLEGGRSTPQTDDD